MIYQVTNISLRKSLKLQCYAYIVGKVKITVERDNYAETRNKKLIFKNNASFRYIKNE